jgi:hypothetical protein
LWLAKLKEQILCLVSLVRTSISLLFLLKFVLGYV